jgi:UDP-glucose 4-epimerase
MKHFLVTGGAGFVGSHLADALIAQGHRVTVWDDLSNGLRENINAKADFVKGDVRDRHLAAKLIAGADFCFHLAAIASVQQCNQSWVESHAVNQGALIGLLEASAKRKNGPVPVIYASSAAVYGDTDVFPAHEDLPLKPISVYGADKAGCELHAQAAGKNGGVPTFGLRPFNIYGPRQLASSPYSGVISIFADKIARGEGLTIYGDGKQTRDFVHVKDIVRSFIAAIDKVSTDAPVINAATGKETSILNLAHFLAAILEKEAKIAHAPARSGDIYRSVACTQRAQALLGIKAQLDIAEGLKFVLEQ